MVRVWSSRSGPGSTQGPQFLEGNQVLFALDWEHNLLHGQGTAVRLLLAAAAHTSK